MKRVIYAADELENYPGFYFTAGRDGYFLKDPGSNLTDRIIRKFINAVVCQKVCKIFNPFNILM